MTFHESGYMKRLQQRKALESSDAFPVERIACLDFRGFSAK